MSTSIQQRVMHYAHHIHNTHTCSWREALLRAWDLHYLRQMLAHGVVEFKYVKEDGTLRTARGTNCPDLIPPSKAPTGHQQLDIDAGLQQPNYCSIPYYDLDREAWRAFSIQRFLQVNRVMTFTPIEC